MSSKKKWLIAGGVMFSIIGFMAVVALVILSALFYPPPDWPEGPPDAGPMVGIIINLCLSSCCLLGPVLLLIGLFARSASSKKKARKKEAPKKKGKKPSPKGKKKEAPKKKGKKSSPEGKKKKADIEE